MCIFVMDKGWKLNITIFKKIEGGLSNQQSGEREISCKQTQNRIKNGATDFKRKQWETKF